jgi:hypothetical protein
MISKIENIYITEKSDIMLSYDIIDILIFRCLLLFCPLVIFFPQMTLFVWLSKWCNVLQQVVCNCDVKNPPPPPLSPSQKRVKAKV